MRANGEGSNGDADEVGSVEEEGEKGEEEDVDETELASRRLLNLCVWVFIFPNQYNWMMGMGNPVVDSP